MRARRQRSVSLAAVAVGCSVLGAAVVWGEPFLVADVAVIGTGSHPTDLVGGSGTLFFVADDGYSGRELWRSDGTADGTRLVRDIIPGLATPFPYALTPVGGALFFVTLQGAGGVQELWRSDGSEAGTVRLAVLGPTEGNYPPRRIHLGAAGAAGLPPRRAGVAHRRDRGRHRPACRFWQRHR
jgi:ELWxxDGT repeat protein